MSGTTVADWAGVTASVRGASHERSGLPNQDTVAAVPVDGGIVAAVADGHGGARYVRSDVGSKFGVEVACELGEATLSALASASADEVRRELQGPLVERIVAAWRARVLDHVAASPFTADEAARAGAPLEAEPLIAYGCTLVLALAGPRWVGLVQIGDGDATVVTGGRVSAPVPGDDRLVGGETTSLCLPSAVSDARVAVLTNPLPDLVILTSDGYANSFAAADWREQAAWDLLERTDRDGLAEVAARLPSWLAESAQAGGDDVSMALLRRQPGAAAAAAPSSPTSVATGRTTATPPARGRAATVAAVVALVLGGAAGWGVARATASDDDPRPPQPTTTTSTSSSTTAAPSTTIARGTASLARPTALGTQIVGFDPVPGQARPRVVAVIAPLDASPTLPSGWRFADGELRLGRRVVLRAGGAALVNGLVWAISADGSRLHAFDTATGNPVGPAAGEAIGALDDGGIRQGTPDDPSSTGADDGE